MAKQNDLKRTLAAVKAVLDGNGHGNGNGNGAHNANNAPNKNKKQKTGKKQKSAAAAGNSTLNKKQKVGKKQKSTAASANSSVHLQSHAQNPQAYAANSNLSNQSHTLFPLSAGSGGGGALQMTSGASSVTAPGKVKFEGTFDELRNILASNAPAHVTAQQPNAPASVNFSFLNWRMLCNGLAGKVSDASDFFNILQDFIKAVEGMPAGTFADERRFRVALIETSDALYSVENEAVARATTNSMSPEFSQEALNHSRACLDLYWAQEQLRIMGPEAAQGFLKAMFKTAQDLHGAHVMSCLQRNCPDDEEEFDVAAAFIEANTKWNSLSSSQQLTWVRRFRKLLTGDSTMLSTDFGDDLAGAGNRGRTCSLQLESDADGVKIKSEEREDNVPTYTFKQSFAHRFSPSPSVGLLPSQTTFSPHMNNKYVGSNPFDHEYGQPQRQAAKDKVVPYQPMYQLWQAPKAPEEGVLIFDTEAPARAIHSACQEAFANIDSRGMDTLGKGVYFARIDPQHKRTALDGFIDVGGRRVKPKAFHPDAPRTFVGYAPGVPPDTIINTVAYIFKREFMLHQAAEDGTLVVTFTDALRTAQFTIKVQYGDENTDIVFNPTACVKCKSCGWTHAVTVECNKLRIVPMPNVRVPLYHVRRPSRK
ncbi:hypothetical protein LTR37_007205 [Vermiconidia calcicola]|uniref:Uncharacterized protein n=1 Tax=Vermiconidia calcicola TaxID=1690605 RepID=A0ACC3NDW3_9PEZI|nr:hypothetical protein LTR37_007205 [Vermiconidia calcicola]